jgi:polyhydroxyalkanoate synthesis regulator phasin
MTEKNERIQILEMIESGVITATEGARLLQALDTDDRLEQANEVESVFSATVEDASSEGEMRPPDDVESASKYLRTRNRKVEALVDDPLMDWCRDNYHR